MLSPLKEAPSSRELDYPHHAVSATDWGPGAVRPWAGGASQLRIDSVKRPVAVRHTVRELQKLEHVHAQFSALMRSDSRAVERILQSYGDRAFPEFRRLGGDQEPSL